MDSESDREYDDKGVESEVEETESKPLKPAIKKAAIPVPVVERPYLPEQPDPTTVDFSKLTPLSPEIISRQATINIGTIGHVAHGKSTVVKAISGVQTVRFKNELERNITIKLGYANAKVYKCDNEECPRPTCYRSYKSEKEVDPKCEREGCGGTYRLLRHVSFVDCPGHDILMSTMLSGAAVMDAGMSKTINVSGYILTCAFSTSPDCRERTMPTAADIRAFSCYRNHEAQAYHHSPKQG